MARAFVSLAELRAAPTAGAAFSIGRKAGERWVLGLAIWPAIEAPGFMTQTASIFTDIAIDARSAMHDEAWQPLSGDADCLMSRQEVLD